MSKESFLADIHDAEGLMVWIISEFADTFGTHAILKGGMELRLADCPRFTNDLDYVFIPYTSKKEIKDRILEALGKNPDLEISYTMHSKCIRYLVALGDIKVQIEVNVAMACQSQELSTSSLAHAANQQSRIIRVMSFPTALAHKLAAWNERGLVRDLYDVYYLSVILNVSPDKEVLEQRLSHIESRTKGQKKGSLSIDEFIEILETAIDRLNQAMVENELRDYMNHNELPGLYIKIIGGMRKVIDSLSKS